MMRKIEAGALQILTVSDLTSLIKRELEGSFADLWVEGELSNVRVATSGHLYGTLKDERSQITVILFRSTVRFLRFQPRDGLYVLCRAHLAVYAPRGTYELIVDRLEPRGLGALQLAFEQLKARLQQEGLFEQDRKKPLPLVPRRIGIVTSPTGAALHDILTILERRFAEVAVLIAPVTVQGEGAAHEIAQAIQTLNELGGVDVLIVGRGGGAWEDLQAFNEEIVARAIAASRIPVISAVGHEVDYTIADFVADLRAPTPSAAAEMVVISKEALLERLQGYQHRLAQAVTRDLERRRAGLLALQQRLRDPRRALAEAAQRRDALTERLVAGWRGVAERKRTLIQHLTVALDLLSPLAVLHRGYSITRGLPSGTVLREATEATPGDQVTVRLWKGELDCRVQRVVGDA